MSIYTYPVHGFGCLPDPDSVTDHETAESAYESLLADIAVTAEHLEVDMPSDVPTLDETRRAIESGNGLVFGFGGWLHVAGRD